MSTLAEAVIAGQLGDAEVHLTLAAGYGSGRGSADGAPIAAYALTHESGALWSRAWRKEPSPAAEALHDWLEQHPVARLVIHATADCAADLRQSLEVAGYAAHQAGDPDYDHLAFLASAFNSGLLVDVVEASASEAARASAALEEVTARHRAGDVGLSGTTAIWSGTDFTAESARTWAAQRGRTVVYTDASVVVNATLVDRPAAWAWWVDDARWKAGKLTAQSAYEVEMEAAHQALAGIPAGVPLLLAVDNRDVAAALRGWDPRPHAAALYDASAGRDVLTIKIPGHQDTFHDRADRAARRVAHNPSVAVGERLGPGWGPPAVVRTHVPRAHPVGPPVAPGEASPLLFAARTPDADPAAAAPRPETESTRPDAEAQRARERALAAGEEAGELLAAAAASVTAVDPSLAADLAAAARELRERLAQHDRSVQPPR